MAKHIAVSLDSPVISRRSRGRGEAATPEDYAASPGPSSVGSPVGRTIVNYAATDDEGAFCECCRERTGFRWNRGRAFAAVAVSALVLVALACAAVGYTSLSADGTGTTTAAPEAGKSGEAQEAAKSGDAREGHERASSKAAANHSGHRRTPPSKSHGAAASVTSTSTRMQALHDASKVEEGLGEVCSGTAPKPELPPREAWKVPDRQNRKCYDTMMKHYRLFHQFRKANQSEDSRNWCWVALKELGCHRLIFAKGRPHLSWDQIRRRSPWLTQGSRSEPGPLREAQPLLKGEVCDRQGFGRTRVWTAEEWHTAWVWFARYVTVYALNLKTNVKRWKALHAHLRKLDIPHTRVWGVDMREENALQRAKDEGLIPPDYNYHKAEAAAGEDYQAMGGIPGTVGCASAHFRAQTTAHLEAKSPIAVVFEDDVRPEDDFVPRLWQMVKDELPCDWQVVSLRSMCPFGTCVSPHLTRVQPDVNEPADRCRHGVNYGFQGVMYRVKDIASIQRRWKRVVFNESRPHCLDVDVALASLSDEVGFYAVPFTQVPGLLTERRTGSSRWAINRISI